MPGREDWPTGLYDKNLRGQKRYYFKNENGNDVYFPENTQLEDAIIAAKAYNTKYRDPFVALAKKLDSTNRPLSEYLPDVLAWYKEKGRAKNTVNTFVNDLNRLKESLGSIMTKSLTLADVNRFMDEYYGDKSNNVKNRKKKFLQDVFSYVKSKGAMEKNLADDLLTMEVKKPDRIRLTEEAFYTIYEAAPLWLQTAMDLALQSSHAVLEVSRIKYSHCKWLPSSEVENELTKYGTLYLHRQKTEAHETSRVAIPITERLKEIIERSREDGISSPYVVHKEKKRTNPDQQSNYHPTQLTSDYISKSFSKLRDQLLNGEGGFDAKELKVVIKNPKYNIETNSDQPTHIQVCMSKIPKDKRPGFHSIRSLSLYIYNDQGHKPQKRAAHKDETTTNGYIEGHEQWTEVEAAEIDIRERIRRTRLKNKMLG